MSIIQTGRRLAFEAPGPGFWQLDAVHTARPWTRFLAEILPAPLAEGYRAATRRYGVLLDYVEHQFVNGFLYQAVRPVEPAEVPARLHAAERAFARRLWREDLGRWERQLKPAAIAAHLRLQAVDLATMGSEQLLEHLERCHEHMIQMICQHHGLNGAWAIPIGDFLAQASMWTGLPAGELLTLVSGDAPESAGRSLDLDRLITAVHREATARALIESDGEPQDVLAELRGRDDEVGRAAEAYLQTVEYRLIDSFDIGGPCVHELPEVLLQRLRLALAGAKSVAGPSQAEVARVRDRVPAEHREAFDELLAEARLTSRIRDERGIFGEIWAGGIIRTAILAAADRLAAAGRIHEPAHLVEAGYEEMRALIAGWGGPSAQELGDRARYRATTTAEHAPSTLGPPTEPPALDGLPPAAARAVRAVATVIPAIFGSSNADSGPTVVRGTGASPGLYHGTARVIANPTEFGRLRPGDVLVTDSASEALNIVLPSIGALVTDTGGVLSHAAIITREYGIPSVVGARVATARIPDGSPVRVDGTTGEVTMG